MTNNFQLTLICDSAFKERLQSLSSMSTGTYLTSSFLYINLGSHMMFILKNRLQAQSISPDKTLKIINELISAIFKENFIKTVMIPQEPMSIITFKDLFRKLAHSSIMKLDNSSMEKLLYLIIMTLKKQTFLTSSPLELYALTIGNMRILQQYAKGSPAECLIQDDIKVFSEAAKTYSFTQYLQIKEYLLTLLQANQTKVINFCQSKHQNDKGKLCFQRRNTHNEMTLGDVKNHPKLNLDPFSVKTRNLPLENWKQWKCSLVIDHANEYEKQSERRKNGNMGVVKEKSLNEMFLLNAGDVTDFEVKLDLFNYEPSKQKPVSKSEMKSAGVQSKKEHQAKQSEIKSKIDRQFENLKIGEEEDLDLLDMMDN